MKNGINTEKKKYVKIWTYKVNYRNSSCVVETILFLKAFTNGAFCNFSLLQTVNDIFCLYTTNGMFYYKTHSAKECWPEQQKIDLRIHHPFGTIIYTNNVIYFCPMAYYTLNHISRKKYCPVQQSILLKFDHPSVDDYPYM